MNIALINKAETYALDLLGSKNLTNHVYHDVSHTQEVVEAAETIGTAAGLTESELEIVIIAAWFHDVGYVEKTEGHEQIGAEFAEEFLGKENYQQEKIKKVKNCILATKVPQKPKSLPEQVLCDADLAHLGKKNFKSRNNLFREEFEFLFGRPLTEYEWLKKTIDFLTSHKFFTDYAATEFEAQKQTNLLKLQKKLRKLIEKDSSGNNNKNNSGKEMGNKKNDIKTAGRGVETMFRNVMRTHVEFSAMADSKANIMISVNTLVLTALFALLGSKLDKNPHLIIPTFTLALVSLVTLVFAVIVTRPKISSGIFTKEEIHNKKANLLFFGNFHRMNLDDFSWGMKEMINDREYLYDSMIKDFYYLGLVLGHKYRYLRICYSIFIYGLIISVIVFVFAILFSPTPTNLQPLFN
ncbi:MAG: HD domain-containing protein [Ignavibacteriales bacterium]|nr:HD domain-containing protein [Ignavibacteriales bacterium]